MKQPQWVKKAVSLGESFSVKTCNPYMHNLCNVGLYLLTWGGIWGIWFLGPRSPSWCYIPLGSVILGILFYSQIILVVHEAAHGNFIISKDSRLARRWNGIFGWLVTIPFGIHFSRHWGKAHILHHNFPMEEKDSENCHVRHGKELVIRLAILLLTPGYVQVRGGITGKGSEYECAAVGETKKYKVNWIGILALTLFWSLIILIFRLGLDWNFLNIFFATFLSIQVMAVLNVSRQTLEHGGAIGQESNPLLRSRTTLSPWRYLLAPWNLSFHFEHHLHPNVPWYALKKYSQALKELVPSEVRPTLYNKNEVWQQLAGQLPSYPNSARYLTQG